MTVRQRLEAEEAARLSPFAAQSAKTGGRAHPVDADDLRTEFQRDRDRIIHCKSFRRLKFKTQVFIAPLDDHYRTRLTHTLEVSQVARTIARALQLNEDLTEAIALGHDLGHTPFGHIGEKTLNELLPGGFRHNEQSLRVVDRLERDGQGLNLTKEVRNGILCHSGKLKPSTLEGQIVHWADRIAYLNHDLDDALRAGVLKPFELPTGCLKVLGETHGERIETMIHDMVDMSMNQPLIQQSEAVGKAMAELRAFLFEHVYHDAWRDAEEQRCDFVLRSLYAYYMKHVTELPDEYLMILYQDGAERAVADFLSGMTDRYALRCFRELMTPHHFSGV